MSFFDLFEGVVQYHYAWIELPENLRWVAILSGSEDFALCLLEIDGCFWAGGVFLRDGGVLLPDMTCLERVWLYDSAPVATWCAQIFDPSESFPLSTYVQKF